MCFLFELAYKLNISGHNCRNSGHKIADLELLTQRLWR